MIESNNQNESNEQIVEENTSEGSILKSLLSFFSIETKAEDVKSTDEKLETDSMSASKENNSHIEKYTVQEGDNLNNIVKKHLKKYPNLTIERLMKINKDKDLYPSVWKKEIGIKDKDKIPIGAEIYIHHPNIK